MQISELWPGGNNLFYIYQEFSLFELKNEH